MTSLEAPGKLRPSIEQYLRRFVLRRRRLAVVRASSLAALLATFWLLSIAVVDRFYALPPAVRAGALLFLLFILLAMIRMPFAALLRRSIDWRSAAEQIEDSDPRFNEMLATVVSQSLAGPSRETSEQLISRLVDATESRISVRDSRRSVPLAPAAGASAAAVVGVLFLTALSAWPWLGLPRLLVRQIFPFANIQPVTTTRLDVTPGAVDVPQGRPLKITARAAPLLGGTVLLRTSTDGKTWNSAGMTPSTDGVYTYQVPSLVRDFQYRVLAGDASAGPFHVRVLRRPLVKEFQVKLNYPPYVRRQALSLTSIDGAIEAPAGTVAEITIVSSEPLKSASVLLGNQRIDTAATQQPSARQVRIPIQSDQRWNVEMLSDQSVGGVGPPDMIIRALPDHPPVGRLMLPAAASLLRPRDQIRIPYQAADDYALQSLQASVDVEGGASLLMPLKPGPDPRRVDDSLLIDLAQCNVVIGQRVVVTLVATDAAGQVTRAAPAYILISPKEVDPYARRRIDDLREAARIAERIGVDLAAAEAMLNDRGSAVTRLAQVGESAPLLVRSVLSAATGVDRQDLVAALARLADEAQIQVSRIETINTQISSASSDVLSGQFSGARALAAQIAATAARLRIGLGAELALVQLETIAAVGSRNDPVIAQLRREVDAALTELELQTGDPDLERKLLAQKAAVSELIESISPIHFPSAASRWAQSAQPQSELLSERLMIAAQIEAVRRDGDLVWARDLLLASRAVRTIDALMPPAGQPGSSPDLRATLVELFNWICLEHELNVPAAKRPSATQPAVAAERIRDEATSARLRMRDLAGGAELAALSNPASAGDQAGAMEANALSSQKQYKSAQAIDAQLYRNNPQLRQRIETELSRAVKIDDLSQRQQNLESSGTNLAAAEAASRQRDIGTELQAVMESQIPARSGADSRQQGLAAVRGMQEELASLPLRLGRIEQLIASAAAARDRIPATQPDGTATDAEAAAIAQSRFESAVQALEQVWTRESTLRVSQRVAELRSFSPETDELVVAADAVLLPALGSLQSHLSRREIEPSLRALAESRRGIGMAQRGLESARRALLDRDPLVAAQWFAREAAAAIEAPATQPALPREAQAQAAEALRTAWNASIHDLANARLRGSASLASILRAYETDPGAPAGAEWGRQGQWSQTPGGGATGVADPPGFEDSLRAYFRALRAAKPMEKP